MYWPPAAQANGGRGAEPCSYVCTTSYVPLPDAPAHAEMLERLTTVSTAVPGETPS